MRIDKRILMTFVLALWTVLSSAAAWAGECDYCVCKGKDTINSCTKCCSSAKAGEAAVTELKLRISEDGRSIVDQNGQEVARFVEGLRVRIKTPTEKPTAAEKSATAEKSTAAEKSVAYKMQGCFKCRQECIAYEGNKCVKTVRTCDWDFDCK